MCKWEYQRNANILAFLTASEYRERLDVLEKVCQVLREAKVTWVLSCSASLFFQGLADDFNDFDILVDVKDIETMKSALTGIGVQIREDTLQKRGFISPYYKEAQKGNVHFDLVGDITLDTFHGRYCYPVARKETVLIPLEGFTVPVAPVEASLVLYGMMEGWQSKRRFKRELCYSYLKEKGLSFPEILEKAKTQQLPAFLEEVLDSLL